MSRAHFQFFTRSDKHRGTAVGPLAVEWRLITANHRDLGRCVVIRDDHATAVSDVRRLVARLHDIERSLLVGVDDLWRWRVAVDGELVAASSRGYSRRIECELSVRQFLVLVGTATINPTLRTFGDGRTRSSTGSTRLVLPAKAVDQTRPMLAARPA